jgi:hypothetical protein
VVNMALPPPVQPAVPRADPHRVRFIGYEEADRFPSFAPGNATG